MTEPPQTIPLSGACPVCGQPLFVAALRIREFVDGQQQPSENTAGLAYQLQSEMAHAAILRHMARHSRAELHAALARLEAERRIDAGLDHVIDTLARERAWQGVLADDELPRLADYARANNLQLQLSGGGHGEGQTFVTVSGKRLP